MTQKERMLLGMLYNPQDEELKKEHLYAQTLLFELNQLAPCQKEQRQALIRKLFGKNRAECVGRALFSVRLWL